MRIKDCAERLFALYNPRIAVETADKDISLESGYLPRRSVLLDVTKLKSLGWRALADMEHIYSVDIEHFGKK